VHLGLLNLVFEHMSRVTLAHHAEVGVECAEVAQIGETELDGRVPRHRMSALRERGQVLLKKAVFVRIPKP
jgi:hypothetical protein